MMTMVHEINYNEYPLVQHSEEKCVYEQEKTNSKFPVCQTMVANLFPQSLFERFMFDICLEMSIEKFSDFLLDVSSLTWIYHRQLQ